MVLYSTYCALVIKMIWLNAIKQYYRMIYKLQILLSDEMIVNRVMNDYMSRGELR